MSNIIEVIDYTRDFPEGDKVQINGNNISKFYATPKDYRHTVRIKWDIEPWPKKYKNLIHSGKLFTLWDIKAKRNEAFVKPDCHPVMIEMIYATESHIYDDSTYIHHYWSDTPLDEFIEAYGSSKHVEDKSYEPIKSRWEFLDFRIEK